MIKAEPLIDHILNSGDQIRGIGIGTAKLDGSGQKEFFFQEDPKQHRFYLVQDAINNQYGRRMIGKASVMDSVPGKTHFLNRS